MSDILLQAIVEKLEALEIALLKQGSAGKDEKTSNEEIKLLQSEFIKWATTLKTNNEKINGLSEDIRALKVNSGNPVQNQVKHIHHFHKQVWLSVSSFIISLLLAYGWVNCSNEKKSFEANDMKYRYWKANGNASLLKVIYYTDSLYNLDEDHFTKEVLRAERKISEQENMRRLAGEKEKNLDQKEKKPLSK